MKLSEDFMKFVGECKGVVEGEFENIPVVYVEDDFDDCLNIAACGLVTDTEPGIFVGYEFKQAFSEDEQLFIKYHEVGHLRLGHDARTDDNMQQNEYDADLYSAKIVGLDTAVKTLKHLCKIVSLYCEDESSVLDRIQYVIKALEGEQ